MWSHEQQRCLDEVTAIIRYAMERKMKGRLGLNLIGNGMLGNQIESNLFFPVAAGVVFMDAIVDMDKNTTNRLAAKTLDQLEKEV